MEITGLEKYQRLNECGVVTEHICNVRCRKSSNPPHLNCDNPPVACEIAGAEAWIKERCWPRKTWNPDWSSYGLKHIMEEENGLYVTNGAFIQAAINLGYKIKPFNNLNVAINIGIKSNHNRQYWDLENEDCVRSGKKDAGKN